MHYVQVLLAGIFVSIGLVGSNPTPDKVPNPQINDGSTISVNSASDDLGLLFLIHRHGDRKFKYYTNKI